MNRIIRIPVLFMILVILFCEITLSVSDRAFEGTMSEFSDSGEVQDRLLGSVPESAHALICSPELIGGRPYDTIFSNRLLTKGKEARRSDLRMSILLIIILCLSAALFRRILYTGILPDQADASSVILLFIHQKDGKK